MTFGNYARILPPVHAATYIFLVFIQRILQSIELLSGNEAKRQIIQQAERCGFTFNASKYFYIFNNSIVLNVRKSGSDLLVFKQVFIDKEYEPVRSYFKLNKISPNLMLDLGANVGYTSAYFLSEFSSLNVIAVEPFVSNYNLAKSNLRNFPNVNVLNGAVWSSNEGVLIDQSFRDGMEWSVQTKEAKSISTNKTASYTIEDLTTDDIDFLKMDIEGAEFELFKDNVEWLSRVRVIAIEIHSECGEQNTITDMLIAYGFKLFNSGELTIGINQKLV